MGYLLKMIPAVTNTLHYYKREKMDTNNVKELFDAMNRAGGSVMNVVWTDDNDPDDDRMVLVVQGREEIKDIRAAIENVEKGWE